MFGCEMVGSLLTCRGTPRNLVLDGESMWYVNASFDAAVLESLPRLNFQVQSSGGVMRVEKYECGAELRRTLEGKYRMTELPAPIAEGQFARLWDAGYQKFLLMRDGRKLPARTRQLANLRRFNEELRTALGVPTYYNEALGSTCQVTVYDRVKGRPGDIADESVGAAIRDEH
jgi:hypothetical protein